MKNIAKTVTVIRGNNEPIPYKPNNEVNVDILLIWNWNMFNQDTINADSLTATDTLFYYIRDYEADIELENRNPNDIPNIPNVDTYLMYLIGYDPDRVIIEPQNRNMWRTIIITNNWFNNWYYNWYCTCESTKSPIHGEYFIDYELDLIFIVDNRFGNFTKEECIYYIDGIDWINYINENKIHHKELVIYQY